MAKSSDSKNIYIFNSIFQKKKWLYIQSFFYCQFISVGFIDHVIPRPLVGGWIVHWKTTGQTPSRNRGHMEHHKKKILGKPSNCGPLPLSIAMEDNSNRLLISATSFDLASKQRSTSVAHFRLRDDIHGNMEMRIRRHWQHRFQHPRHWSYSIMFNSIELMRTCWAQIPNPKSGKKWMVWWYKHL